MLLVLFGAGQAQDKAPQLTTDFQPNQQQDVTKRPIQSKHKVKVPATEGQLQLSQHVARMKEGGGPGEIWVGPI